MAEEAACQDPKSNILEVLSSEVIVEIFSHLEIKDLIRAAQVCKKFKELAYHKRFWKKEAFICGFDKSVDENLVQSLIQKGIRNCCFIVDEQNMLVPHFLELLPKVDYLALWLNNLDQYPLARIHEITAQVDFSGLTHLELSFLYKKNNEPDMKLGQFLEKFPNVQSFTWNVCGHNRIRQPLKWAKERKLELKSVFETLNKLTTLKIDFRDKLIPFPVAETHQSAILVHLILQRLRFSEVAMRGIGPCFPNLRDIVFIDCIYTGPDIAKDCGKYIGSLQELEFRNCQNIAEEAFNGIEKLKCTSSYYLARRLPEDEMHLSLKLHPEQ